MFGLIFGSFLDFLDFFGLILFQKPVENVVLYTAMRWLSWQRVLTKIPCWRNSAELVRVRFPVAAKVVRKIIILAVPAARFGYKLTKKLTFGDVKVDN